MFHLLLSLLFLPAVADACGFPLVYNQSMPTGSATVKYARSSRFLRGPGYNGTHKVPEWVPLKIYTVYHEDVKNLHELTQRDLSNYITRALRKLGNMLKVRRTDKVETHPCNVNNNPPPGFPKDTIVSYEHNFVLYITVKEMTGDEQSSTLATCSACDAELLMVDKTNGKIYHEYDKQYDGLKQQGNYFFGRPISGHMTVNKGLFEARKMNEADKWISTMMHEITHALVFSPHLYQHYINCDESNGQCQLYPGQKADFKPPPQPQKAEDVGPYEIPGIVEKVTRPWLLRTGEKNHDVHVMILPAPKREAAAYFDCPTIDGVELENQGGQGTAFAHLEKRVYEHDTMGGVRTEVNAFSRITLSFFEASGWYKVNYTAAEPMAFGKGKKCNFVMKSCGHYKSYPFCSDDSHKCNEDRTAIEMCNSYSSGIPLEPEYDYFPRTKLDSSKNYGTAAPPWISDFCPYYTIYNKQNGRENEDSDSKCSSPVINGQTNASLQIFSKTARCFELKKMKAGDLTTVKKRKKEDGGTTETSYSISHGCYEHKCEDGMVWIKAAKSKFYPCYKNGQSIHVDRRLPEAEEQLWFEIQCPACSSLCGSNCTDHSKDKEADKRIGDSPRDVSFFDRLIGNGADGHTQKSIGTLALLLLCIMFVA